MENSHKLLETHSSEIGGEGRLKNLTEMFDELDDELFDELDDEVFDELDYENAVGQYFYKDLKEVAKLFWVSEKIAKVKLFEEFTYAPLKIAEDNLGMIAEEEGVDQEGSALRLGSSWPKLT